MAQLAKTKGYVRLTGIVEPVEEGGFFSVCPELSIASQGESIEEALSNLREAIDVYLAALSDLGDMERVFRDKGISVLVKPPGDAINLAVPLGKVASPLLVAV